MVFKKIIFQNRYVELETPPRIHGKNHLKFLFWLFETVPYLGHLLHTYGMLVWSLEKVHESNTSTITRHLAWFQEQHLWKVRLRTFRRFPEPGPLLVFLPIKIFLQMLILVILPSKSSRKRKEKKRAKPIVGREGSQSLETCQGWERGDPRSAGGSEVGRGWQVGGGGHRHLARHGAGGV